jgi:signal-transduction protein with cAMP-binding, CBS, and nucleotidyltransferase domain
MAHREFLRREPDIRNFRQDETIFGNGNPGDCMHAVLDGTVEMAPKFAPQMMRVVSERLRRRE